MLKVIIAGSRDWSPMLKEIDEAVDEILGWRGLGMDDLTIVSGTAAGADRAGESWARANLVPFKQFPAKWSEYGRAAGIIRNQEMADYADAAIVFWKNQSSGSANMIANMVARDKQVHVVTKKKALAVKPEPVLLSSLDVEDAPF